MATVLERPDSRLMGSPNAKLAWGADPSGGDRPDSRVGSVLSPSFLMPSTLERPDSQVGSMVSTSLPFLDRPGSRMVGRPGTGLGGMRGSKSLIFCGREKAGVASGFEGPKPNGGFPQPLKKC